MKINSITKSYILPEIKRIHSHDLWEIIYVTDGNGRINIDDKIFNFSQGTVVCIPPDTVHYNMVDDECQHISMLVDDFLLFGKKKFYAGNDDQMKTLNSLITIALRIFYSDGFLDKNTMAYLSNTIECYIYSLLNLSDANHELEAVKYNMLCNFTNSNYTVSDAMKHMNYSEAHFRKLFQTKYGVKPVEYLRNLRLEYARNMLINEKTDFCNIEEISLMAGFNDFRYFIRRFKEKYKLTPGKARNIELN